jgi:hypothetical protein
MPGHVGGKSGMKRKAGGKKAGGKQPAKGSQAMKDKMKRLRGMRGKK